jgi:hypothetical protein
MTKSRLILAVILFLGACEPKQAEALYTAQLTVCAETADSKKESRECRAEVDRKWGVSPRDAGGDQ